MTTIPMERTALHFELDDLLPLVDAGELLGLMHLEGGSLILTELGKAYADAEILAVDS
jgi:NitT/TauT family transport system ATP-binding protein